MEPTKPSSRLIHSQEQREQEQERQTAKGKPSLEFSTPEEAIRYDAEHTEVPVVVEKRLQESVAAEPTAQLGWWQRLFGRNRSGSQGND
jgi:hypothetical protein